MEEKAKKVEEKKKPKQIRCPKCNSKIGYFKIREKAWQCRNCGYLNKEVII